MQLLLDNGNQHVSGHSAPNLRLDRVLAGAQKLLDTQMLLDPFEEQLDLPTVLVQGCDGQRWQCHVVGQKDQHLSRLRVLELDAPQVLGVVLAGVLPIERNGLIADKARGSVYRGGVHTPGVHIAFGTGYEEGGALVHGVKAREVQIAPVHDVESARLDGQHVQHMHIVHLPVADVDEGGNCAAQVQQGVHLHSGLGGAKRCPVEQTQTQVDGGGVQCVDGGIQIHAHGFLRIQSAGSVDQSHRQSMLNAPVARVQGIGQRRACRNVAHAHVKKFGLIGRQTRFDVAQRLPPGQLGKRHDAKQLGTTERAHPGIAAMAIDDATKGLPGHKLHDLREQGFACVHEHLQVIEPLEHA